MKGVPLKKVIACLGVFVVFTVGCEESKKPTAKKKAEIRYYALAG